MKWLALVTLICCALTAAAQSVPTPAPPYTKATLTQTLEIIRSARREIYLLAPSLRNADVVRAVRSRLEVGVKLRLLITNQPGYTGFETGLRGFRNVDARWLPERIGGAMLLVDDRALVIGSVVSGLSSSGASITVTRAELVPAMAAPLKELFARARRVP